MAKKYIKHHIIPKTYLKHFSLGEDGKGILVIDSHNQYNKQIQVRNSGDKIFWERKFYNSSQFSSPAALEKMFGQSVEVYYNDLIAHLKRDQEIQDWEIKLKLLTWIFFSIYRASQRRWQHKVALKVRKKIENIFPEFETRKSLLKEDLNWLAKELHLREFADQNEFKENLERFNTFMLNKKWEILKALSEDYWITSDNPGYLIRVDDLEDSFHALPNWKYEKAHEMFFPLTKDYALHVYPYSIEDDVSLNLTNTPIERKVASKMSIHLFNRFTYATMHRLLISPDQNSLLGLAIGLKHLKFKTMKGK